MGAGVGCCGKRKGDNCCTCGEDYKTEPDIWLEMQVDITDGPEVREKVKRIADSLKLITAVSPRKVSEKWISPLTCQGAVAAMELSALTQALSSSLSFRTHLKSTLIESKSLPQLLTNLSCADKSLRLASLHFLCLLLSPQQSELTSEFLKAGGLQELSAFLGREKGDGVLATTWRIALMIGQLQETGTKNPELISLYQILVYKLRHMKSDEHIHSVAKAISEAGAVVLRQLREVGLAQGVQRLRERMGRKQETPEELVAEVSEVYILATQC